MLYLPFIYTIFAFYRYYICLLSILYLPSIYTTFAFYLYYIWPWKKCIGNNTRQLNAHHYLYSQNFLSRCMKQLRSVSWVRRTAWESVPSSPGRISVWRLVRTIVNVDTINMFQVSINMFQVSRNMFQVSRNMFKANRNMFQVSRNMFQVSRNMFQEFCILW